MKRTGRFGHSCASALIGMLAISVSAATTTRNLTIGK
jgi:hypothetical protein